MAVEKAVEVGFVLLEPSPTHREQLRLLRNIYEHWADYTPWQPASFDPKNHLVRSGHQLVAQYPGANPFSFRYDGIIGGVFDVNAFLDEYLDGIEDDARRQSGLPPRVVGQPQGSLDGGEVM